MEVLVGAGNLTTLNVTDAGLSDFLLPVPANAAVGDLMVAICVSQASVTTAGAWILPSGWVSRFESTGGRRCLVATYAVTDATALMALGSTSKLEPNSAWRGSSRGAHVMFRVSGADLAAPWAGTSLWTTGTSTVVSVAGWTSSADAGALIAFTTNNNSSGSPTPDGMWTGMTTVTKFQAVHPTLGGYTGIFAGSEIPATPGTAQDAEGITLSPAASANLYGIVFGLKAAA